MKCPGCGAALTSAMVAEGDCGFCGSHLPTSGNQVQADLADAIEKLAAQPKVVHVTRVELRGPDIQVGGLFDSITARIAGCFTGCFSAGITLGFTALILGFTAWQIWVQNKQSNPRPEPAPAADHPRPSKRH